MNTTWFVDLPIIYLNKTNVATISKQPRKFKIAIAVPPTNDVDVYCHDLGYIVILDENKELLGFNVTVGGGMGVTQYGIFVAPDDNPDLSLTLPSSSSSAL